MDKTNEQWQRPLKDRETNFRLVVYSRSPTSPEYMASIDPVDFEIIGLAPQIRSYDFWRYINLYVCMYVCMYESLRNK